MQAKINSLPILIIGIFIAQCAFSQKSNIDSLVRVYYENYQFQKVIDSLQSDSLNYKQNQLKAKSYEKLGNVEKAVIHYQKALTTMPQDKQLIFSLANCYEKSANYTLAIEQLNKLIKIDSNNSYFHRELANLYLKNQQFILSIASFAKARELNKNDIESGVALVNLYLKLALNEKAMEIAKSLISKETKNKAVLTAHLKAAYRNKDYKSAIESAKKLFAVKDSNILVQKIAGLSYFHLNEYENSIQLIENVTEVETKSDMLFYYLGIAYREVKDYEKAEKAFEKSIKYAVSENIENYYTQLAVSYEEAGNHAKAIFYYQAAYKSSRDKIILYHLARNYDLYYQDKTTALEYYERYLKSEDTANLTIPKLL